MSLDAPAGMIIERDLPIEMNDGIELRADVYRPDTDELVPVIMTAGPYGKGVRYQDSHYKPAWDWLANKHPDLLPGSSRSFLAWETVDPELWVSWGYAVIRVDSRGAGRSPGFLDVFSRREAEDFYSAIEWAGELPWSNGKVGLNGISYYAIMQWMVASLQPPHLAAMIPWEGAADAYRDMFRHGGILSNMFTQLWYPGQVQVLQHGNPGGPMDRYLQERTTGPVELSAEELEKNRADPLGAPLALEMDDGWYRDRSPDWPRVKTPFLSAASWGGFGLHQRGNFEAFAAAASTEKWLECHPGRHEEWFYLDDCMALQRRFFDHYLKGDKNGWDEEPRVLLNIRRPFSEDFEIRKESEWPLSRTRWTELYLDAAREALSWAKPEESGELSFDALSFGVTWQSPPLEHETELTGPMALRCFVSSSTADADLFVTMQAFAPDGREVHFQGTVDAQTPLAQGWLRASHRKLDANRSKPYQPFHAHDEKQPLSPGDVYQLDIEIWPQCVVLPPGFTIAVNLSGRDFDRTAGESAFGSAITTGSGPFLHNHPVDRPPEVFGGVTTIHTGGGRTHSSSCRSFPAVTTSAASSRAAGDLSGRSEAVSWRSRKA